MANGFRRSSPDLTWPKPSPAPRRTPRTCRRAAAACGNGCSADMPVILRPHIYKIRVLPEGASYGDPYCGVMLVTWQGPDVVEIDLAHGELTRHDVLDIYRHMEALGVPFVRRKAAAQRRALHPLRSRNGHRHPIAGTGVQDCLIALLEWELCAAQARIAEYRQRLAVLRQKTGLRAGQTPRDFSSQDSTLVRKRDLAGVLMLLDEDDDDKRLRQRLASARHAAQHQGPTGPFSLGEA